MSQASRIAERLLRGERSALSRLISWAENRDARFPAALSEIYGRVGGGWRIGITGPPGSGKSTLASELTRLLREGGRTVGILAVDPSSPLTGGALLGDRIRMEERTLDEGVYIRSMASRESRGGLARAAVDACDVMDAYGFGAILLETVGVGQAEYDVVGAADTVLVVLCPGAGDAIQAMKAGLLEVADVLVVNKADLPGAERLADDLEEAVDVRSRPPGAWRTPVVLCSATRGTGVEGVLEAAEGHRAFLVDRGLEQARRAKRLEHVRQALAEGLAEAVWGYKGYRARAARLLSEAHTPYEVTGSILADVLEHLPAADASEGTQASER